MPDIFLHIRSKAELNPYL